VKNFFENLNIPMNFGLAFGVVITALAVMKLVSISGLNLAFDNFVEYRSLARQANADGRVQANIISTRVYAKEVVIDPTEQSVLGVQERAAATIDLIAEAQALATDTVYRVLLESQFEAVAEFIETY